VRPSTDLLQQQRLQALSPRQRLAIAFLAGALGVLAFAPFGIYPLALISPALLFLLWLGCTPGQAFREGWSYGAGLFGFGVFWMHISIDKFGNVGAALAIVVTLIFVLTVALYYGLIGWIARRFAQANCLSLLLILLPALWVLGEWLRGWVFTGFPWLALGYSQIDSPLAGWAPLLGVYGVSWLLALSASLLLLVLLGRPGQRRLALIAAAVIWGGGSLLQFVAWTAPAGEPLKVSLIQGNIKQEDKWKPERLMPTLQLYAGLTRQHWASDIIIWPETAVPAFAHQVEQTFLAPLSTAARNNRTALMLGIPVWIEERQRYYNAMLSLGKSRDHYYKRHLVPFGEFLPLQSLLKPLLDWLQIPMSDFSAGDSAEPSIQLDGYKVGVSICYEDAFGEEMIQALPGAAFLVNASNDAWFGDSLAPPQHLQIARMRALESGRYLLRSTNTGISAIVDARGKLLGTSPAFEQHVLSGRITPMQGATPYVRIGNWGIISLASLLLIIGVVVNRSHAESALV